MAKKAPVDLDYVTKYLDEIDAAFAGAIYTSPAPYSDYARTETERPCITFTSTRKAQEAFRILEEAGILIPQGHELLLSSKPCNMGKDGAKKTSQPAQYMISDLSHRRVGKTIFLYQGEELRFEEHLLPILQNCRVEFSNNTTLASYKSSKARKDAEVAADPLIQFLNSNGIAYCRSEAFHSPGFIVKGKNQETIRELIALLESDGIESIRYHDRKSLLVITNVREVELPADCKPMQKIDAEAAHIERRILAHVPLHNRNFAQLAELAMRKPVIASGPACDASAPAKKRSEGITVAS